MIYAERGNKVINIKEESIQKYVEQGFKIYDDNGVVLSDTIPTDIPSLKKAYAEHKAEIESLKAENEQLKAQIAELSAKPAKKVEKPEVAETAGDEQEVKKVRKSNKAE